MAIWTILSLLFFTSSNTSHSLDVELFNIKEESGSIRIALFNSVESFDAQTNAFFEKTYSVQSTENLKIYIPNLPAGSYAIAAFHDINDNGELDTNIMGIPKEPYAFSNNVTAKWSKPTFAETKFTINKDQQQKIRMATWSKR